MAAHVVVLGANPALQRTLMMPEFAPGRINRAAECHVSFGGKGQTFAHAFTRFRSRGELQPREGQQQQHQHQQQEQEQEQEQRAEEQEDGAQAVQSGCTVVQFVGGAEGEKVVSLLDSIGVRHCDVQIESATRMATTIVSTAPGAMYPETELIDPSPSITATETSSFIHTLSQVVQESHCKYVAIMGTAPSDCGPMFYQHCLSEIKQDVTVLLDGYKDVRGLLQSHRVNILKINFTEFSTLVSEQELDNAPRARTAALWVKAEGCNTVLQHFADQYRLSWIAITDGGEPSVLIDLQTPGFPVETIPLPAVSVVNAIGCGDTVAAVLLASLADNLDMTQAFRRALAAGCAAAETTTAATFVWSRFEQLYAQMIATS